MSEALYEYFGGIEGGATHTKFALVRSDGQIISSCQGEGTNQYLIGIDECLRRIKYMVEDGLKKAGLPINTVIRGLGLSLSGGDETVIQDKITSTVKHQYPTLTEYTFVGSDTQAALATALSQGGVVLIAGTGSNCQLINSDGSKARSGGWGHLVGDESSATWISLRALKILFDHEDKYVVSPFSIEVMRDVIFNSFQVKSKSEILDHLYAGFDKSKIASLCKHLAQAGLEKEDPLCRSVFEEAGRKMAQHLCTVADRIHPDLKEKEGGVPVVCMGSVFKSWKLMEPGFVEVMRSRVSETGVTEVTMLTLTKDAVIGAAALGAKAAGKVLPLDYSSNATVLFSTKF